MRQRYSHAGSLNGPHIVNSEITNVNIFTPVPQ